MRSLSLLRPDVSGGPDLSLEQFNLNSCNDFVDVRVVVQISRTF